MNKSFTLIEILVVIVIVGILSAFIIVSMAGVSDKATIAKAQAFSNSIKNSLMMSLVSEWRLDDASGTTIQDQWGTNPGTWYGSGGGSYTSPSWRTSSECVSKGCLAFDGTDDYINCGSGTSINITTAITLSAWVKTTNSSTVQMILEKSPSGTNGYNILSSNGQFQGRIYPSSIESTVMLSDGVWHHIVMSNQNVINGWNLYFDGVKIVQQNGVAILANAQPLYIGMRGGGTSLPFTGLMDDVRIYNQAIPTSQTQQNYYLGLNKLLLNSSINKEEFAQRLSGLSGSLAHN